MEKLRISQNDMTEYKDTNDIRETADLHELINKIQMGDIALRNQFLSEYAPFARKNAQLFSGGYPYPDHQADAFAVAMQALNESIDVFNTGKGKNFIQFAEKVIKRRLIDDVRRAKRHKAIPFSSLTKDDESDWAEQLQIPDNQNELELESIHLKDQIAFWEADLNRLGITFDKLVYHSPKHKDAKQTALRIAKTIIENQEDVTRMLAHGILPVTRVSRQLNINHKTVERNRVYIIALILLLIGDMEELKNYALQAGEEF